MPGPTLATPGGEMRSTRTRSMPSGCVNSLAVAAALLVPAPAPPAPPAFLPLSPVLATAGASGASAGHELLAAGDSRSTESPSPPLPSASSPAGLLTSSGPGLTGAATTIRSHSGRYRHWRRAMNCDTSTMLYALLSTCVAASRDAKASTLSSWCVSGVSAQTWARPQHTRRAPWH